MLSADTPAVQQGPLISKEGIFPPAPALMAKPVTIMVPAAGIVIDPLNVTATPLAPRRVVGTTVTWCPSPFKNFNGPDALLAGIDPVALPVAVCVCDVSVIMRAGT